MRSVLTSSQRAAVEHQGSPLLVLAGPGTGKTLTLTHRIVHLIERAGLDPASVAAVTFTRKAAEEMRSRLGMLLADHPGWEEVEVDTIHALAARLLRGVPGGPPTLLSEEEQLRVARQAAAKAESRILPGRLLRQISLAKGALLEPASFHGEAAEFAAAYEAYEEGLREKRSCDFDDLVLLLLRWWQRHPEVLAAHQGRFAAILVDEFQDVNQAQYQWIKLLGERHRRLWVVGDVDQSIYGFRGSHVTIFHRFLEDFPDATVVKLEDNFRSTSTIVHAASAVIGCNRNPLTCQLRTDNPTGAPLQLLQVADEHQEAAVVVSEIQRLVGGSSHHQLGRDREDSLAGERDYAFGEMAVLYRTRAQSRPLAAACRRAGIPFQVVGEKPPFEHKVTQALLGYLGIAVASEETSDLRPVFDLPPRGFGERGHQWLASRLEATKNAWALIAAARQDPELPVKQQAAADQVYRICSRLRELASRLSLRDLCNTAVEMTGLAQHCRSDSKAIEGISSLLLLAQFYGSKPAVEVYGRFAADLALWRRGDFYDRRADAVSLMTVHAAKGLEFPVVFLCGLEDGLVPYRRPGDQSGDVEEERRLFYVGLTRAREVLYLTTAAVRRLYGERRQQRPSPFVAEIPKQYLRRRQVGKKRDSREPQPTQMSLF